MRLSLVSLLLLACANAADQADAQNYDELLMVLRRENSRSVAGALFELSLVEGSNLPIVDEILKALADSGLANSVIDFALLNPELLNISADATIFVLRSGFINLADVFIALQKSGLIIQVLELSLQDPAILPGVLKITKELLRQQGLIKATKRADVEDLDEVDVTRDVSKRESEALNEIFAALKDSGLAVSVIQHLLTDPNLTVPAATFLSKIIQSHAITLPQVVLALIESNLIWNLIREILGDPSILKRFEAIIADRIAKGIIPPSLWEQA